MFESFTFLVVVGLAIAGIILIWVMYDAIFRFSELPAHLPKENAVPILAEVHHWGRFIHAANDCCEAVKKYAEKPYPFAVVPSLPITGCDRVCHCKYVTAKERRYHERRTGKDRRQSIRFEHDHPDRRNVERRKNWPLR